MDMLVHLLGRLSPPVPPTGTERIAEESGATAVEYGLMVALIAVVIMGAVQTLGINAEAVFRNVALITALN